MKTSKIQMSEFGQKLLRMPFVFAANASLVTPLQLMAVEYSSVSVSQGHPSSQDGTGRYGEIGLMSRAELQFDDDDGGGGGLNKEEMKMTVTGFCWPRHIRQLNSIKSQHSADGAFRTWLKQQFNYITVLEEGYDAGI